MRTFRSTRLAGQGIALAWQGDTCAATAAASEALEGADELGSLNAGLGYTALGMAALAAGDAATARTQPMRPADTKRCPARDGCCCPRFQRAGGTGRAETLLQRAARPTRRSATATGWYSMWALTTRARVAVAQDEPDQAERDAHDALACAAELEAYLGISESWSALLVWPATLASHREAARLFGAAHGHPAALGEVATSRCGTPGYEASVAACEMRWTTTTLTPPGRRVPRLSTEEAIAYARRGRGQRKRPSQRLGFAHPDRASTSSGWSAKDWPTTTSPQGFSSHPAPCKPTSPTSTRKLGLTSRVQLAQEAARHA